MAANLQNRGKTFEGLETRIEEAIKCQVCKKQVCWPLVVCFQGHGMCLQCNNTTKDCSVCKSPLLQKPPSILENLLQILPKRCKYSKYGCQDFEYVYDNHENRCEFRTVTCMLGKDNSCEWRGFIKDWYMHGLNDHNIHAKLIDYWPSCENEVNAQYYDFNSPWVSYNMIFNIQNEHFVLYSEKSQSLEYHIYIVYLPKNDSSSEYSFQVHFLKGYSIKKTLFLPATPLKTPSNIVMGTISLETLQPLVDSHGNLRILITQSKNRVTFNR